MERLAGDVYSLGKVLHSMFPRTRPFDREDHRSARNQLGKGLVDRREYELVHELLDKMIAHSPRARYRDAKVAAEAVTRLIRILEANGRPILIDFFSHVLPSVAGREYKFLNGPEDLREGTTRLRQPGCSLWGRPVMSPQPAQYSHNFFMISLCDVCGHVQFFRPDLVKGAKDLWMRKPQ